MFSFFKILLIAFINTPIKHHVAKSSLLISTLPPPPPPPPPSPPPKWPSWLPPLNDNTEDYDGDSS